MDRSDEKLVRAVLGGDQDAFNELANRYRDAAFGIALCHLGDVETARDAAQEALVAAYVDLPTLRDPSSFRAWFSRIAATTALRLRRSRKSTVSLDVPEVVQLPGASPDPEESALRGETGRQTRDALSALTESERLAVILHYVNGYSHEEIGGMVGASVSAVKSRIHRGRSRLREELRGMVEQNLKESIMERFELKPLDYWVFRGFQGDYGDVLSLDVQTVFGRTSTVADGEDYLVCGKYVLKGSQGTSLSLAVPGVSTTYTADLTPGKGSFELYCHVERASIPGEHSLSILMPDEKSSVQIILGRALDLHPLACSLTPGPVDTRHRDELQIRVQEVLGTSPVAAPGAAYMVRGRYGLADPDIASLAVDVDGTTTGFQCPLRPGEHSFEVVGEVQQVNPGKERSLHLHLFGGDEDIGIHTNILLETG
jgi:RNA polymerase sigma-70 factor, ECF subfamily